VRGHGHCFRLLNLGLRKGIGWQNLLPRLHNIVYIVRLRLLRAGLPRSIPRLFDTGRFIYTYMYRGVRTVS
jgi:hypothetical protein